MKNILFMMMFLSFGVTMAQVSNTSREKKNKNAKYIVEVNGNCDQCKKRIEKAAYTVPGVKSASWDVESHMLNLIINEEKSSVGEVESAVAKVGHDSKNVKATDEVYNNLHHCCLYKRDSE